MKNEALLKLNRQIHGLQELLLTVQLKSCDQPAACHIREELIMAVPLLSELHADLTHVRRALVEGLNA